MWSEFRKQVTSVAERLREAPANIGVSVRMGKQSGFMWAVTRPGIAAFARVLTSGSQNPSQIYRVHAQNSPDKPALIWRDRVLTWRQLDERIDRLAAGLDRRGIGRKQSLVSMVRNRPECVEISAATARIGAATVAISWRSTAKELVYLLNHSGARGIVLEPELLPVLDEASPELEDVLLSNVFVIGRTAEPHGRIKPTALESLLDTAPKAIASAPAGDDDAAVVVYTSGTTGKPKGAVRKFPKDTMQAAFRFINETPMRVDDVHLVTCPLYHSTAYGFLSLSHILGCTVVIMDEFKPETFLEMVQRHSVTSTAVVPTMLHRTLDLPLETRRRYDTRSLRIIFSGGAALSGPLAVDFMDAFGDVVFNFYGATETGLVTLATPDDLRAAPGTIGRALPANEIRLLDDDKQEVESGGVGELYVRNKLLVSGYHADDAATEASMAAGFFSVGDLARCDRYGRYFIEGRKRDMVISGGVNVYPAEVEGVLEQHPDIDEAAVIGVPDREWGERVRAFIVPRAGASLDEGTVKSFARERLAGPKVPRDYVFVDSLPRNPTGKVLKRELRERA